MVAVWYEVSLAFVLLWLGMLFLFLVAYQLVRSNRAQRRVIRKKLFVGVIAGFIATATYDLSRLIVVNLFNLSIWPFEAFPLFGRLIAGATIPESVAYAVGTAYHVFNGLLFAIAYCFALGGRPWPFGICWALGLEVATLVLYPDWLDLENVMREFTIMSMVGHITYGMTLGILSWLWLGPERLR